MQMLFLVAVSVLISLGIGLGFKVFLDKTKSQKRITLSEYLIYGTVIVCIVAPLVGFGGWKLAKGNRSEFGEFYNGWEKLVYIVETMCTRDGPCIHEYDCESYPCNPHDCPPCICISRNADGGCISESCATCWDTCYHDCPYVTREYSFYVDDTLGNTHAIGEHWFPLNPEQHRWTGTYDYRANLRGGIPQGIPPFWQAAFNRCEAGNPGPVTVSGMVYDNYILASQSDAFERFSAERDRFLEMGLLPELATDIVAGSFYHARKVYFVGWQPADSEAWYSAHEYVNSALGTERQGDMHVVIIQHPEISSVGALQTYKNALMSYWSAEVYFGRCALSKNGVVVVLSTSDGQTVDHAVFDTGMPEGNGGPEVAVRALFDKDNRASTFGLGPVPLTPEAIFGEVRGEFYTREGQEKVRVRGLLGIVLETAQKAWYYLSSWAGVEHSQPPREVPGGLLTRIIFGVDTSEHGFVRISMSGDDADDIGTGYLFLKAGMEPTSEHKWLIVALTIVFSSVLWGVAIGVGDHYHHRQFRRRRGHW